METGCVAAEIFEMLSGKWTLPVLYELNRAGGAIRFGELLRATTPVTQKELTKTLRHLEDLGLVERRVFAEIPPRVEYELSELGRSIQGPIAGLAEWLREHRSECLAHRRPCPQDHQ